MYFEKGDDGKWRLIQKTEWTLGEFVRYSLAVWFFGLVAVAVFMLIRGAL